MNHNPIRRMLGLAGATAATVVAMSLTGLSVAHADTPSGGPLTVNLARDCPDMYQGAQSECVRTLQDELRYLGAAIDVDGIYGPQTANAVLRFQTNYSLRLQDGIAGPETRTTLQGDYDAAVDAASYNPNVVTDTICSDLPFNIASKTCSWVLGSDPAG